MGWSVLFALVYLLVRKHRSGAVICSIAVLSHWILDLITHRPDLPLYPGGESLVGFGLWNSVWAIFAVELPIFAAGIWLYLRRTTARDRIGSVGLWCLLGFLLIVYVGNIFGPSPEAVAQIAWLGQAQWILVAWSYWVDGHRQASVCA